MQTIKNPADGGVSVIRIGFEPMACCLEGSCSIQLSYRTIFKRTTSLEKVFFFKDYRCVRL